MMTSNMEQSTGVVELEGSCSTECLRAFVHFIYTAEVDRVCMDANWEELLDMAVKYSVKALQSKCVDHILTNIIPEMPEHDASAGEEQFEQKCEHIVTLSKIGYKYELTELTEAVIGNVVGAEQSAGYHSKFLSSSSYCKLKQLCPGVALDICERIARKAIYIKEEEKKAEHDPDIVKNLKLLFGLPP